MKIKPDENPSRVRRFRIRDGVKPYGGRIFPGVYEEYPNGRRAVTVFVDTVSANKNRGLGGDPREYRISEVDEIK